MGSKPKKSDYQATAAEKMDASVAKQRADFFRQNYGPLLKEQMNFVEKGTANLARSRAAADVQQSLSDMDYRLAQDTERSGQVGQALQGNLAQADRVSKNIENKMATSTIGTAQGQAADASSGISQVARISASDALNRAKARQQVSQAKFDAGAQLATAGVMRGAEEGLFGKKIQQRMQGPSVPSLSQPAPTKASNPINQFYGFGI